MLKFLKKKIKSRGSEWLVRPWKKHLILTFHRIRSGSDPFSLYDTCPSIPIGLFSELIFYVKKNYKVVPLKYLSEQRSSKTPLAAITFDDGWQDNYQYAYPILKDCQVPATIFVTTGKIGSTEPFWQQKLGCLFQSVLDKRDLQLETVLRSLIQCRPQDPIKKELFFKTVRKWKSLSLDDIRSKLDDLPVDLNKNKKRLFLNHEEILEMSRSVIDFGSHTVDHTILTNENEIEAAFQLKESKQSLEQLLQKSVYAFAYPNGDYSSKVAMIAGQTGYTVGCTTKKKKVSEKDSLLKLPRIEIPSKEEISLIIPRKELRQ